jgi:DNA processing protein
MTGGAWGGNYQARPDLTRAQKANWLRLIRSENVGPITFRDLLNFCGSAEAAIERLPELMAKSRGKRRINLADPADIDREMDTLEARGWRLIARGENAYPSALQHIAGAPPLISVAGDVAALMKPCVAIVGSRNASANGQKITNMLGRDLVDAGYAITSGFARGIDTAAHRAALKPGGTVAVFAGGLDVI